MIISTLKKILLFSFFLFFYVISSSHCFGEVLLSDLGFSGSLPEQWVLEKDESSQQYRLSLPAYQNAEGKFLQGFLSLESYDLNKDEKTILENLPHPTKGEQISSLYQEESTLSTLGLYKGKSYRAFYQKFKASNLPDKGRATLYFIEGHSLYRIDILADSDLSEDTDYFEILSNRIASFLFVFHRNQDLKYKGPNFETLTTSFSFYKTNLQMTLDHSWQLTAPLSDGFTASANNDSNSRLSLRLISTNEKEAGTISDELFQRIEERVAADLAHRNFSYQIYHTTIGKTNYVGISLKAEDKDKKQPSIFLIFFQDGINNYVWTLSSPPNQIEPLIKSFEEQVELFSIK